MKGPIEEAIACLKVLAVAFAVARGCPLWCLSWLVVVLVLYLLVDFTIERKRVLLPS